MFGAKAVKHIAMPENIRPEKKATRGTRSASGLFIKPKAATTARTMLEEIVLRAAPHSSSAAMTSSMLMGVAMMASKVFW